MKDINGYLRWQDCKFNHKEALALMRCGDFYETYQEDAERASEILGLVLTDRGGYKMCGFPLHALDTYLPKLIRSGVRVAIADVRDERAQVRRAERENQVEQLKDSKTMEETIMKPFDMVKAKAGEAVMTRDGREVRIVCYDKKGAAPIMALVEQPTKDGEGTEEAVLFCKEDGTCTNGTNKGGRLDLVMKPKERRGYVTLWRVGTEVICSKEVWPTRAEAEQHSQEERYVGDEPAVFVSINEVRWKE